MRMSCLSCRHGVRLGATLIALSCDSAAVLDTKASDHRPVLFVISRRARS